MTRTRELTFFFFFFFYMAVQFSELTSLLSFIHVNIWTSIYQIWSGQKQRERDCSHTWTSQPCWTPPDCSPFAFLSFFFFVFFFFFGCFSNMQNQANCLSVNIICDFSCTYTFYVLSDWVNRDSKQKPAVAWFPQKKRERERNELGPSLMLHIGPTSHHHRPISRPPGAHKLLPDTMNISWWHSAQWKAPFHPSKHFK